MRIHSFTLGPFMTNTFVVEDEATGAAMLIDPTIGSERLYDMLMEQGLSLGLIVNTHGHIDHVYGNAFFREKTGAPLAIHRDDAPLLRSMGMQAVMFGLPMAPPSQADHLLVDGEDLRLAELSFRVIHTPGHTPGGVCLYGHGVVLAGYTLFAGSIGRTDLPGGDYDALIESIKTKLLVLPQATVVYSGHGPETTIGEEKEHNPFLQ